MGNMSMLDDVIRETSKVDPLLFIYYLDDEVVSVVGDHSVFSEVNGFMPFNEFAEFFTPDMCEKLINDGNIGGIDLEHVIDEEKVYIVEKYFNLESGVGKLAPVGIRTRGTVLLLRQLG